MDHHETEDDCEKFEEDIPIRNILPSSSLSSAQCDIDQVGLGLQSPNDIAKKLTDDPFQPFVKHFPFRQFGDRKRNFQPSWYKGRPWLEYSISHDAAFCFPCRFFKANFQGPGMRTESLSFVNEGFVNWKKAMETNSGLKQHEYSLLHKKCMASWEEFKALRKKSGQDASISTIIDKVYAEEVLENRAYIETLADTLRFTALQGIAQRGHRETKDAENKGNFLELLDLIAKHNKIVKKNWNLEVPNILTMTFKMNYFKQWLTKFWKP